MHKWDFVQKECGMGEMLLVFPVEKQDFLLNNPLILQGFFFFFFLNQFSGDSFRHTAN